MALATVHYGNLMMMTTLNSRLQLCACHRAADAAVMDSMAQSSADSLRMHTALYVRMLVAVVGLLLMMWLVVCGECEAAMPTSLSNELSIQEVMKLFETKVLDMRDSITDFCQTLVFYLGLISLVIEGSKAMLKHEDFNYFFYILIRIFITFGLVYFLIFNGYSFATDLINSLIQLGTGMNSKGNLEGMLSLMQNFFNMADAMAEQMAGRSKNFYYAFTFISYALLAAFILRYVTYYVWAVLLCVLGLILVPFGVMQSTRFLAYSYLKNVLATGISLMTLCFVYIIGIEIISTLTTRVSNYIDAGGLIRYQDAGYVILVMLFVVCMGFCLPSMMGSMVSSAASSIQNMSPIRAIRQNV